MEEVSVLVANAVAEEASEGEKEEAEDDIRSQCVGEHGADVGCDELEKAEEAEGDTKLEWEGTAERVGMVEGVVRLFTIADRLLVLFVRSMLWAKEARSRALRGK